MSDTSPAIDPQEPESGPADPPEGAEHLGGDDVATAPALQPRDSGGGDLPS